jgi:hypothetical protein
VIVAAAAVVVVVIVTVTVAAAALLFCYYSINLKVSLPDNIYDSPNTLCQIIINLERQPWII